MEQLYMIEIFVDKVTIFESEEDGKSGADKNLIIKIKFGPKVQFIIKEGHMAPNNERKDDIVEQDDKGRRKWTRSIRVGKSYLFPSYSDTVLMILSKFPLEIEVWDDDETEVNIFVGTGTMHWDTEFFHMLKETANPTKLHEPLSIKQITPLMAECCCKQVGEIAFILRISVLGDSIITEFQQLMKDPDSFVFRTNRAPSMFQCKKVEGDDPNFCMVGSLYETTTLEDPDVINKAKQKIEVCTKLQSCGVAWNQNPSCLHRKETEDEKSKKYQIDKVRMGDISGPCGNTNCSLAHKIKKYIRNLDTYKKEAPGKVQGNKDYSTRNVCGKCVCTDDRWHRESCPELENKRNTKDETVCQSCGGITHPGQTCEQKGQVTTGVKSQNSKTIGYIYSVTRIEEFTDTFNRDYIVQNINKLNYKLESDSKVSENQFTTHHIAKQLGGCCSKSFHLTNRQLTSTQSVTIINKPDDKASMWSLGVNNKLVYNMELKELKSRKEPTYNVCTEIPENKDCKCNPPKPKPPCKTFDCECIDKTIEKASRKAHKSYCPAYKHKVHCPVNINEDEVMKVKDEDEDEAEPLPYGLPPIKLGPCPVMGKPCTYPDGFARMYKTGALPALPPSYNDAGKVCCSKEYERIKKAIEEYMKYEKDHDFRCINKFNVDTEKRCCDKDQVIKSLTGKSCCGSHKNTIQEKYKEEKK